MKPTLKPSIHLAYADDHKLIRQTICLYLKELGCFKIDLQASNGDELIKGLKKAKTLPDICILDINMPVKNGYCAIKEIKSCWPTLKFLILTAFNDEYSIIQMLKNGANGYLLKNCSPDDLKNALLAIYQTGNFQSELTTHQIHKAISNHGNNLLQINEKEIEFLSYCCYDYHYNEIAEQMNVSPRTIDGYRDTLFKKLSIRTRAGLVMYAVKIGIAPSESIKL